MKIKVLVAIIAFIVLATLAAAGFFIYKTLTRPENKEEEKTEVASPSVGAGEPLAKGEARSEERRPEDSGREFLKETRLVKDDFEIILPPGWEETANPPEGVLLMVIDSKEDVSAGVFQKLNFRTNFSLKGESRQKYADISDLEAYVESIKTSLVQVVPGIKFTLEEPKTISGQKSLLVECESTQNDADFKTLLVFIETEGLVVYAISFNTFSDSWLKYRNSFYQTAESFKPRYSI